MEVKGGCLLEKKKSHSSKWYHFWPLGLNPYRFKGYLAQPSLLGITNEQLPYTAAANTVFASAHSAVQKVRLDHSISCYFRAYMCLHWRRFPGFWFPLFFQGFGLQESKKHIFENKWSLWRWIILNWRWLDTEGGNTRLPVLHWRAWPWPCWRPAVPLHRGWSAPPNLLPSQTPARPSCVSPGYPLGPQLKAGVSGGPPLAKRFPFQCGDSWLLSMGRCCDWLFARACFGPWQELSEECGSGKEAFALCKTRFGSLLWG